MTSVRTETEPRRVAIVTGASSGIGKATVRRLLAAGYVVYGGARQVEKMSELVSEGATIAYLDLSEASSIDHFVSIVLESEDRVDVLVNNAGYGLYGAVEDIPLDEARRQFEVNLFGLVAMTNAVLPTMRSQRSGKIVHVGSSGGKVWSTLGGWYQASKFALEGLSDCTRNELRPFGIDVILIEPGSIESEWLGIATENMRRASGEGVYRPIVDASLRFYARVGKLAVGPDVVGDVIVRALAAKRPKARYATPASARFILILRRVLSDRLFDWLMCKLQGIPRSI